MKHGVMSLFGKIGKKMYREKYYKYQTVARGILDKASLETHFIKLDQWYWSILKNYLPRDKSAKCIDVPCGYGNFLYFLRNRGYKNIVGYDLDEDQIALAKLLNLPARHEDIFDALRSNNEPIDLISSFDFIEHITKDDALSFIELCFEKLNTGGVLVLRTPSADGPFGGHDANNDLTHEWTMTSTVLRTLLEMNGFRSINIIDEHPRPIGLIGVCRWLVYFPTKLLASLLCICLGMRPPKIWSRSMIAVSYKQ